MCLSHGTLQTATNTLGGAILAKSPSMSVTTSIKAGLSYWASKGYWAAVIGTGADGRSYLLCQV